MGFRNSKHKRLLNHKKPKQDPIIAPQKIDASPTPSIYVICK